MSVRPASPSMLPRSYVEHRGENLVVDHGQERRRRRQMRHSSSNYDYDPDHSDYITSKPRYWTHYNGVAEEEGSSVSYSTQAAVQVDTDMAGPPPGQVRLPPVQFPSSQTADYVARRPSLASDPFLHAYPPTNPQEQPSGGEYHSASHVGHRGSIREASMALAAPIRPGDHNMAPNPDSRPPSPTDASGAPPQQRYLAQNGGVPAPYEYTGGSSSAGHNGPYGSNQQAPPHEPIAHHNYRFGGPSQIAAAAPDHAAIHHQHHQQQQQNYDYNVRRHSSYPGSVRPGPTGSGAGSASNTSPQMAGMAGPEQQSSTSLPPQAVPTAGGLKRKSSGEDSILEHVQQVYPYPAQHPGNAHLTQGVPYAKRRGSSVTYDKLGNLSLSDSRRDSAMSSGALSPWEDDRRGSGGSWTSVGSQGYSMSSYAPPPQHMATDSYDQRGPAPASGAIGGYPSHPHSRHGSDHAVMYDGSRGQMGPPPIQHAPPQDPSVAYTRRPSIGIDQLVQGPNVGYGPPPSGQHPHYRGHGASAGGMLPSVAHSPPDSSDMQRGPSPPPPSVTHQGPSQHLPAPGYQTGPPVGPQAPWSRGPILGNAPPVPRQHGSNGSIEGASMGYGPGGHLLKDSPYSRSPELRVTHKLAERKRRKEMSQLFDDLKDSLPFDRGLKSSKWEILTKAVEHIATLKTQNEELVRENSQMREHFGLGPAIGAPSNQHVMYEHARPPGSSHSQSSQASLSGQPMQGQSQQQYSHQLQQQQPHRHEQYQLPSQPQHRPQLPQYQLQQQSHEMQLPSQQEQQQAQQHVAHQQQPHQQHQRDLHAQWQSGSQQQQQQQLASSGSDPTTSSTTPRLSQPEQSSRDDSPSASAAGSATTTTTKRAGLLRVTRGGRGRTSLDPNSQDLRGRIRRSQNDDEDDDDYGNDYDNDHDDDDESGDEEDDAEGEGEADDDPSSRVGKNSQVERAAGPQSGATRDGQEEGTAGVQSQQVKDEHSTMA